VLDVLDPVLRDRCPVAETLVPVLIEIAPYSPTPVEIEASPPDPLTKERSPLSETPDAADNRIEPAS